MGKVLKELTFQHFIEVGKDEQTTQNQHIANNVAARADREHQLNDHRQSPRPSGVVGSIKTGSATSLADPTHQAFKRFQPESAVLATAADVIVNWRRVDFFTERAFFNLNECDECLVTFRAVHRVGVKQHGARRNRKAP